MLKNLLEEKKCFKLICGAGNEDLQEVENLVALYSKAGCRFFDLSAKQNVLQAAQKGLDFSVSKQEQGDYHFCVSVGIQGEPHLNKVKINKNNCKVCKKCIEVCLQGAVAVCEGSKSHAEARDNELNVHEEKCIGCLRCLKVCDCGAIEVYQKNKPIEEILNPILNNSIVELLQEKGKRKKEKEALRFPFPVSPFPSCLELHASGEDEQDVNQRWQYLNENFGGMLSVCIDRSKLGNEAVLKRIKNLIKGRKPYTTIIQADGAPMSGGEDDFKTTLQAVAMAEIFQNADLPVYILLSGGTNSKSAQLAKQCGINFHGVSVGSYARKIVKKYIEREDFLQNEEVFNEALKIAKNLVDSSINSL